MPIPFYNTPSLVNPVPTRPEKTGQALLDKLEDDFLTYREDGEKGYFHIDPKVIQRFRRDIAAARESLKTGLDK